MRKTVLLAFATGFALTLAGSPAQAASKASVATCQKEANGGYALALRMEPSLRASIESHRKQLSAACAAFASGKSGAAALSQCLRATSSGPAHIQRARYQDHGHIARQREICRDLAGK